MSPPRSKFTGVNTAEGIRALEFYDPVAKKHGQAHMQARLGITQWLLKEGIARVEEIRAADGTLADLYIRVGLLGLCISGFTTHPTTPARQRQGPDKRQGSHWKALARTPGSQEHC